MTDLDLDRWAQQLREASLDPAAAPQRIAELCVEMLGVSGAGISLVSDTGNRAVVCATDDVSARIEELQVTLGEGPCIDAVSGGGPVMVADLADRDDLAVDRWPAFLAAVTDAGVRAVFAFPLRIGAIRVGAIDLYRTRRGGLDQGQLAAALLAAESASVGLLSVQTPNGGLTENAAAIDNQALVHQATGMVMVQLALPIEQAFLVLRARAFSTGRPLSELAKDVVERRVRFTPEDQ